MMASVATGLEMHGVFHPAQIGRSGGIAGLVGRLDDAQTFSAVGDHLRHERKRLEAPFAIQSSKNLVQRAHFHPISGTPLRESGKYRHQYSQPPIPRHAAPGPALLASLSSRWCCPKYPRIGTQKKENQDICLRLLLALRCEFLTPSHCSSQSTNQAIQTIFTVYNPRVIAVHTTCLSETIGDDLPQIIQKFISLAVILVHVYLFKFI